MTEGLSLDNPSYRRIQLVALLVIPLIQLAANPAVFINPGANVSIDAWVNTGFFLSLPSHLERFGFTYYSTRLSWLLPGFVAHRVLPPLAANYALHLFVFYALLWVTYRFLASGADRHIAMLGTLLVAWSPAILAAIGWDYVDGVGILYLMTTVLCIERAVNGSRDRVWSVAAGAAAACLVIANLAVVPVLLACGTFLILRAGASRWRWIIRSLAAAFVGVIITLVVFATVNRGLGGQWWFLEPSIRFASAMSAAANPWRDPNFQWNWAVWLVVPACVTVGSTLSLIVRSGERGTFTFAVQAAFLTAAATWAMQDVATHSALLKYPYYVSYLVPLALVALPLQLDDLTAERGWRVALRIELAVCAAFAAAHVGFLRYGAGFWTRLTAFLGLAQTNARLVVITSAVTAVGLVAVVSLRSARRSAMRGALVAAGIAFVFAAPHLWQGAGEPDARARFQTVADAHRFIGAHLDKTATRFWYRFSPRDAPPFRAIASTYLWGWVLVNEDMPRLTANEAATLRPDTQLVLLLNRRDEEDDARSALRQHGYDYSVTAGQQFGTDSQSCLVLIAKLGRVPLVSRR